MTQSSAPAIDIRKDLRGAVFELKAFSRRGFFTMVGLVGLAVGTLAAAVVSLRYLIPNVTYDDQPDLHPPRLHGPVVPDRQHVPLPVSRLPIPAGGGSLLRTRAATA